MFQQALNEKIKNVNLLEKEDLHLFNELKNKYPYAEIFQLIFLQLTKKNDTFSFEDELSKVAYKIRDRNKLVEILQNDTIPVPVVEEVNQTIENLDNKDIEENNLKNQPIDESILDHTNDEITKENDLDTQIAAEAFSTIFSKDFEPTIQYQIEEDTNEGNQEEIISTIEKEQNKTTIEIKSVEKPYKSFTNWLKTVKKEEKLDKNQIIDTIISTNPTISRPKKEFYNPSKQAIKSVDDEQLVYTETLAKILEMQGNFSKAISAYKQLSLTIPEKNTYFAQKIKELNEKLNTK